MKTALTIAAAIFSAGMLLAPAAEACISCEYKPEVLGNSSTDHSGKGYAKKRAYVASKSLAGQAAKKRLAAPSATPSLKPAKVAKAAEPTKVAAKTESTETQSASESTTVATQTSVESETSSAESTPAVTAETKTAPVETAQADVGCKKFIPAVGITVTVACE